MYDQQKVTLRSVEDRNFELEQKFSQVFGWICGMYTNHLWLGFNFCLIFNEKLYQGT
jgi:hypothetical protein